jgi:glycosyltransferase involved in cell wall biosynthesis
MKILALETLYKKGKNSVTGEMFTTHVAVDFYRIVQPMTALGKEKGYEVDVLWDFPILSEDFGKWEELVKSHDCVYTSYIDNSLLYVAIKVYCDKWNKPFIIDLDDNIWAVSPSHPHYSEYKLEYTPYGKPKMSESLYKRTLIIKDSNYITVTCQRLKNAIHQMTGRDHKDIFVFPNYIDLDKYDYKKIKPKESSEIVISYSGGASHFPDVTNPIFTGALKKILNKYENTVFVTNGFYMPQLKTIFQNKYRHRPGYVSIDKYIDLLWPEASSEADIVVAPLEHSQYSLSKTYIKYLEYGAAKLPGIYENIEPYTNIVKDGENGYLANSLEEWVDKLSMLIENKDLRKKIGEEAYKTTKINQMKDNLQQYKDFFDKIGLK